ncbi:sulfatase [Sporosarcina sp. NPDC096371]|uniref:sulfatase family protein n=1 Tax=Sporosarcina sp. NPDC096371 TaxID=3364530 RepID=UPI003827779E
MESPKQPNLIYLFADQWRRQAVGYEGEDEVLTPNIDAFAEESVVFSNAVTCSPLCSPHRASLLTGRYPMSTGVYTNCKIGVDVMLSPDEICISDVLAEAGYDTGYIGKWHLDLPELNVTDQPQSGANGWDAFTPSGPKRHGFQYWYSYGAWDEHLSPHYWQDSPKKIKVNTWSVKHETDKAIDFMRDHDSGEPFALFVSWNPPHSPFDQVPDKYKQLYKLDHITLRENVTQTHFKVHTGEPVEDGVKELKEKQLNYFAAITGIDDQFGRILQFLKENQLEENTVVVLTSDHGEMMGSHGLMAKHVWYEESIGVPFCIRWPKVIAPRRTDLLLNSVDIMPTLLRMLQLDIPNTVEGIDLSDYIIEEKSGGPEEAYISAYPGRKEVIEVFKDAGIDNRAFGWRAIRTQQFMYVIHHGYAPDDESIRLLYDLAKDKFQLDPERIEFTPNHPIADVLDRKLRSWIEKMKDPFLL